MKFGSIVGIKTDFFKGIKGKIIDYRIDSKLDFYNKEIKKLDSKELKSYLVKLDVKENPITKWFKEDELDENIF